MKYWLVLWRSKSAGGRECVAQTADLDLVRIVIDGLHTNFLLEDDEQDRVFEPAFIRTIPAAAAGLVRAIRQAAGRERPEEKDDQKNEGANNAGDVGSGGHNK